VTRALLVALLCAVAATPPQTLRFGRFGDVRLVRDDAEPTQVVLLLAPDAGALAQDLAARGALVIAIDPTPYLKALSGGSDGCAYPAGELEGLSQFVQKTLARRTYSVPFLIGVGPGATLVRGAIEQAPPNTFRGALTLDFDRRLTPPLRFCAAHGSVSSTMPVWRAIDGAADRAGEVRLAAAFAELVADGAPPRPALADDVSDLPLVSVAPSGPPSDAVAVILSGDGGWASLDREIGDALATRGIPVIGFDSLQYFWTRRTPEESAEALARVLRHAQSAWPGRRFALIGYSRGADVLPFLASRLPSELRERVALVALVGPERSAEFEFHISDWLSSDPRPDALPIAPEVAKLAGTRVLCVYGRDESESLCRDLAPDLAVRDERPGGHHFGGDYAAIAARIAQELAR